MLVDDAIKLLSGMVFGVWDIVCWIVRAWFGIIDFAFGGIGWLLTIISMYFLLTGQTLIGAAIFAVAFGFFAFREAVKLVSFWLSDQKYALSPEAFVGDIIGTGFTFVLLFGILFGVWFFIYPAQWLLVMTIALIPITILNSVSRFIKNFLAMIKSKLDLKPK